MKKRAFTLFEILLSLIIFSLIVGIIFRIYTDVQKSEISLLKQQLVVSETNDLMDTISDLSLDYSIDYEEYFNRSIINCISEESFARNNHWSCGVFSTYWNSGVLYYCNSQGNGSKSWYYYYELQDFGCAQSGHQSFNQYKYQFWDITDSTLNNWNDDFLWSWPISVFHNTWVQELYLINKTWDHRIFFRRHFLTGIDLDEDWYFSGQNESLYSIQILKLKWFDAGGNHNFDEADSFTNNWYIDTWACDAENWFFCSGNSIGEDYSNYRLPLNSDDWRVNLTDPKITISDRNIEVWPAKDPYLAKNEAEYLIDPFITIAFKATIFWKYSDEDIVLQTSIWFKNSYFHFDKQEYTGFLP